MGWYNDKIGFWNGKIEQNQNCLMLMLFYFTILKHHFIIIPYYFTISPTSQNFILLKYYFLTILYYLFLTAIYFQIAGNFFIFFIFFSLSLPCSLSLSLCPSISLSLCLTASQVCGSLWCWVWLGGGSWVSAVDCGSFFGEF